MSVLTKTQRMIDDVWHFPYFRSGLYKTSEEFFTAVKNNDKVVAAEAVKELAGIPESKLKDHLNEEDKAKAFWINIYNTYVQYLLKANPELFNDRNAFFKDELITLAGEKRCIRQNDWVIS